MSSVTTFFTPPKIPKVDLDLVDLAGGGAAPTQFDGTTRDGRHVYVRYRGGGLTIDVAKEPGGDALIGDCVLDVQLGPIYDGAISVTQFLKLTGLTVDHPMPDDGWSGELDLSGATTFWRSAGLPTTAAGAREVLAEVQRASERGVEIIAQDGQETRRLLARGEAPSAMHIEETLASGGTVVRMTYSRFKFDFPGYGAEGADEKLSEQIGVSVSTAGSRSSDLKYDSLLLSADFATRDTTSRKALEILGDAIAKIYPRVEYVQVDPVSGDRMGPTTQVFREDHHIRDWVAANPRRFRKVGMDRATGKYFGLRPIHS